MTKAADKTLKQVISTVIEKVKAMNTNKLELAYTFHWARYVLNWPLTSFGSWGNFREQTIVMSSHTVHRYITAINMANGFKYSQDDCKKIVDAVGWTRFVRGLSFQTRRLTPDAFIKKYKNLAHWDGSGKKGKQSKRDRGGDRAYTFSLPSREADKYDSYLHLYGMTEGYDGRRRGVRDAMIKLINKQLK